MIKSGKKAVALTVFESWKMQPDHVLKHFRRRWHATQKNIAVHSESHLELDCAWGDDLSKKGETVMEGHSLSKERSWTYPLGLGEPLSGWSAGLGIFHRAKKHSRGWKGQELKATRVISGGEGEEEDGWQDIQEETQFDNRYKNVQ